MLFLLLLLHGASFSSAEFLTPVLDHGDAILPDLCQQETVIPVTWSRSTLLPCKIPLWSSWAPPWTSWTSPAATPSPSPPRTGTRPPSAWTLTLVLSGVTPSLPTAETSSLNQTLTTALGVTWSLRRIRMHSLTTWLKHLHHRLVKRHVQMQLSSIWGRTIKPPLSRTPSCCTTHKKSRLMWTTSG